MAEWRVRETHKYARSGPAGIGPIHLRSTPESPFLCHEIPVQSPEIGDSTITKEKYIDSKWTRVNLRWKGGQPKSPNGPTQNFNTQVKAHFPCRN